MTSGHRIQTEAILLNQTYKRMAAVCRQLIQLGSQTPSVLANQAPSVVRASKETMSAPVPTINPYTKCIICSEDSYIQWHCY